MIINWVVSCITIMLEVCVLAGGYCSVNESGRYNLFSKTTQTTTLRNLFILFKNSVPIYFYISTTHCWIKINLAYWINEGDLVIFKMRKFWFLLTTMFLYKQGGRSGLTASYSTITGRVFFHGRKTVTARPALFPQIKNSPSQVGWFFIFYRGRIRGAGAVSPAMKGHSFADS